QKKLIMLPSETMIWQPEFTDKTLSRKPGAVQLRRLKKPFDEFPNLDICNNSEFGIKAPDCFMRDILFSGVTWNTLPKRAGNISL
ncbi:hypothetical protein, partial [Escherichia coli]